MDIVFTVVGTPQPQGSVRAFTPKGWKRPILTSANKNLKPWRQEVSMMAQNAMQNAKQGMVVGEGIFLAATFYFDKPKSVKKDRKITKPDLDKLLRAIGDGLTGIVYKDDSQIDAAWVYKKFGSPSRVEVRVFTEQPSDKEQ